MSWRALPVLEACCGSGGVSSRTPCSKAGAHVKMAGVGNSMLRELGKVVAGVGCEVWGASCAAAHFVLASPKSQILRSQEALSSRLLGLRSRCSTLAVCTYLRPRSTCGRGQGWVRR